MGRGHSFCWGSQEGGRGVEEMVVDGAWKKELYKGVAAWCYGQYARGSSTVHALSATSVGHSFSKILTIQLLKSP